jgi:hypothetical protein
MVGSGSGFTVRFAFRAPGENPNTLFVSESERCSHGFQGGGDCCEGIKKTFHVELHLRFGFIHNSVPVRHSALHIEMIRDRNAENSFFLNKTF